MKLLLVKMGLFSVVFWLAWELITTDLPPRNAHNICDIFDEKPHWLAAARNTQQKWGVPVPVLMSIMFQESSFRQNARPPKTYFLGFIPIGRASSAYGFSQALDKTWDDYQSETNSLLASRTNFNDAIDFMGWFIHKTNQINKISYANAQHQYLNYHEGWGGYKRRSYRKKRWLVKVSRYVKQRARRYTVQYRSCRY
ncbi:MAG: transglycosylase SLT domain-containing protein [Cocleimonas sp.]|nr:transglycosylase SLT domain-containing protein [Cocleimonas sp.]